MSVDPLISQTNLFGERQRTANSISPEQALINMIKVSPPPRFGWANLHNFSDNVRHRSPFSAIGL